MRYTLSSGAFRRALKARLLYRGRTVTIFGQPSGNSVQLYGIAVRKSVKGAVNRNRAKRRARELVRQELLPVTAGRYQVVVVTDESPSRGEIRKAAAQLQ